MDETNEEVKELKEEDKIKIEERRPRKVVSFAENNKVVAMILITLITLMLLLCFYWGYQVGTVNASNTCADVYAGCIRPVIG